jgi:GNAT superfamily N-acetyltransferase
MTRLKIVPLTSDRWTDFEVLFGKTGACGGCWCMHFHQSQVDFKKNKGDGNQLLQKGRVDSGQVPGLLAYLNGEPVGWVCAGPRDSFYLISRSKVLAPIDDSPTWAVVCFFLLKSARRQGLSLELLNAAGNYARENGAMIIEGYPAHLKSGKLPDPFIWTGVESIFEKAGYSCAVRRGTGGRGIWRKFLSQ